MARSYDRRVAVTRPRVRAPELRGSGGWINVRAPLSLTELRGKVVLLDFWTLACINCIHVLEELRALEERFADVLVVVGVHSPKFPHETDHEAVARAVARHRVAHPVLDDPEMRTWQEYGVRAWPTLVLIDPQGYVVGGVSGEGHGDALTPVIEELVASAEGAGTLRRGPVETESVQPEPAALAFPGKVASDGGERLAVADTGHDRVLVLGLDGVVQAELGPFAQPQGVRFDGEAVVVCETAAGRVWRAPTDGAPYELLAEDISSPWDVVRADGRFVVCEAGRHRLWAIDAEGPRPIAGTGGESIVDGPAAEALLAQPSGLAALPGGGVAFADSEVSGLRTLKEGRVDTLVGQGLFEWGTADGPRAEARMQHPLGVAAAPDGALFVADTFNARLRVWRDGRLATLPVEGLDEPGGLDLLPDGRLVVADTGHHRVVIVDPQTGHAAPLEITGAGGGRDAPSPRPVTEVEPLGRIERPGGAEHVIELALDLGEDDLDHSSGPPVWLTVSAEPPSLLGPGPTSWRLDALPARVEFTLGASGGRGRIAAELRAAGCSDTVCRVHTRRAVWDAVLG